MSSQPVTLELQSNRKRKLLFGALLVSLGALYLIKQPFIFQDGSVAPQDLASPVPAKPASPASALLNPGFDAVSADDNGMLIAAGRGPAGFAIVLKSGTQTVGETRADENGEWVLTPEKPLPPGSYLFTLEATDAAGATAIQGKTALAFTIAPHSRPAPRPQLASATPPGENRPASEPAHKTVAVKRGDTLWVLARRHFGNATRYPEIAAANKDQIKNPDLIFPRQQVSIPQH